MTDRVAASERNAQLDVLRGIAILSILFMNIPYLAGYSAFDFVDPRWLGWTALDRLAYGATRMIEGTARGLLQLLFGAGMMIMTRRAMVPDGPVQTADIFLRRNMWLIAFGLFNVWVLMWAGDILLPYGIAALFLFPFRLLRPRTQFVIGALILCVLASEGMGSYADRRSSAAAAATAEAKQQAGQPLTADDRAAVETWRKRVDAFAFPPTKERTAEMAKEADARRGGMAGWYGFNASAWLDEFVGKFWLFFIVVESFATMLIGAALYQWGIIQGRRTSGFYIGLLTLCYAMFGTIRAIALGEAIQFTPEPKFVLTVLQPFTREAIAVGHIALVALLLRAGAGAALLRPFAAPGRLPLSVYFSAAIACALIFGPFGLGQWGLHGAAGQFAIACAIIAAQIVAANLWLRAYETGPFEWLWKTLAYGRRQPFRRAAALEGAGGVPVAAE